MANKANTDSLNIPLVQLPRRLRENYAPSPGVAFVSYQKLYHGAIDSIYPAHQGHGNRWFVAPADLRLVAEAYSLVPKAKAA